MMPLLDALRYPREDAQDDTDQWHNHFPTVNTDGNLTYIDLFAGCGGLSLGLERSGFGLVLAVEKSPMASETFYHNFIKRLPGGAAGKQEWAEYCNLTLHEQAERRLVVNELGAVLAEGGLLDALRRKDIDLVAGGPPCQGFSMAGKRNPNDPRNELPWQFLDFVRAVQPKAVIIENVVGIGQDFLKRGGTEAPFAQLRLALEATEPGYVAQPMRVNAMHFGVPQHRPRMLIVALRKDLAERHGLGGGLPLWKSDDPGERPLLAPLAYTGATQTVDDALWDLGSEGYLERCGRGRYAEFRGMYASQMHCDPAWFPPALPEALPPAHPANHTLRKHSPGIELRFQIYQYLDSQGIRSNILNIPSDASLTEEERVNDLRLALRSARLPAVAPNGRVLAGDLDELVFMLLRAGTKKHSQRALRAHLPSPTMMSLPDDFVHHVEPRTLTVREMARLQSFPDQFEFRSKETTGSDRRRFEVPQYTQVGNAVPPLLAEAVGVALSRLVAPASVA